MHQHVRITGEVEREGREERGWRREERREEWEEWKKYCLGRRREGRENGEEKRREKDVTSYRIIYISKSFKIVNSIMSHPFFVSQANGQFNTKTI